MATVSPGIYVREFDFSDYVAQLGGTTLALVGGATKGPLNTPTLITSEGDLVNQFGPPVLNDYALQTAIQYLKKGSRVLFVRIASDDVVTGAKTADAKFYGGVRAYGSVTLSAVPSNGDYITMAPGNPVMSLVVASPGTVGNKPITAFAGSVASLALEGFVGGTTTVAAGGSVRFVNSVNPVDGTLIVIPSISGEKVFQISSGSAGASSAVTFSAQVADADRLVLNDGVNAAITFEFDANNSVVESATLKQVVIGANITETITNLVNKIATLTGSLNITAVSLIPGRCDFFDSTTTGTKSLTKTVDAGSVMTLKAVANNITVTRGGTAALTMTALFTAVNTAAYGVTATNLTSVAFEFNTGSPTPGNIQVLPGTTMFTAMQNLIAKINTYAVFGDMSIEAIDNSAFYPSCTLIAADVGAQYNSAITITQAGAAIAVTGMSGGVDAGGQQLAVFSAISPGPWGNGITVQVAEYRAPGVPAAAPTTGRTVLVTAAVEPGATPVVVEVFQNVDLDPASDRYLETVLSKGITGELTPSAYITADVYPAGPTSSVPTGVLGLATTQLGRADLGNTPGQDGISGLRSSNGWAYFVGTVNGNAATGLQALRNPETTEFNLLACPGITHTSVIQAGLSLCRARGDALYLIDPPLGLTVQGVTDWHNGLGSTSTGGVDPTAPAAALDDSYGALFWPWLEINDPYTQKTIWLPPCGFVAAAMSVVDNQLGPWWTAAGFIRGSISANRSEYSPTLAERDTLVGGSNRVNPIVNFQGKGLKIYGNRTLQRRNSALNSLHVRRMLLYAEKVCATAVQILQFNPNDPQTWRQFTDLCNTQLAVIKAGRGISDFRVICDSTTNTATLQQNKTMRGKLLIIPVEAAEIIQLDFALFAAGATFDESKI